VLQDLRHALRLLGRAPGYAATLVLTVAIGIGATTAVFSVVDAVLLRPLRYPSPDRLVRIWQTFPSSAPDEPVAALRWSGRVLGATAADIRDWQALDRTFSHVGTSSSGQSVISTVGRTAERLVVRTVTTDYFGVYGATPSYGRFFSEEDARPGAPAVLVVSHAYWTSRLGGDPGVVGRQLQFAGESATVVGVLPAWFPQDGELWKPLSLDQAQLGVRAARRYPVNARLQPGVTVEQAQRELDAFTTRLALARSEAPEYVPRIESMYDLVIAGRARTVWILLGAVTLVLLVACVNAAGLQLASGTARQHELAVRASMGAGRMRLIRQVLSESLLVTLMGGAGGVLLAWWSLAALVASLPIQVAEDSVRLNSMVLGFALLLSLVSALASGLVPALRLSDVRLSRVLAHGSRNRGAPFGRRTTGLLIGTETALAVVLLTGAGLMVQSVSRLSAVDLGFDPARFVTLEVEPVDPDAVSSFYPMLLDRIRAMPDVEFAGAALDSPLSGRRMGSALDVDTPASGRRIDLTVHAVSPGYFEAIGVQPAAGRLPGDSDLGVAVLSDSAARKLSGDRNVIGRRLFWNGSQYDVIGIVPDLRSDGPEAPSREAVYLLADLAAPRLLPAGVGGIATPLTIVLRPRGQARGLVDRLRQAARAVGPPILEPRVRLGTELFRELTLATHQQRRLLGSLGLLGLVLALVGIYAVTAFTVTRRTPEIGVRLALGATRADVIRAMMRDTVPPLGVGLVAGLTAALFTSSTLEAFLFQTSSRDPWTLATTAAGLVATGVLATWWPARQAALVDPVKALSPE